MLRNHIFNRIQTIMFLAIFLASCAPATTPAPTETSVPTATFTPIPPTPTSTVDFMLITVMPTPPPPEPTLAVFTPEQEVLKTVIHSYFDARYLALNSFQLTGFEDLVSDKPDGKEFLKKELGKLAIDVIFARLHYGRYMYYKYFLNFRNIVVDTSTQTVTITVVEDNEIIYEISEHGPENSLIAHMSGLEHIIVLRNEEDQWKIVSDYYGDFLWRTMRKDGDSIDEMLKSYNAARYFPESTKVIITPEPAQIQRWKEYENALARKLLPLSPPEKVLCEWELSGQSGQEVYVWAVCKETAPVAEISQFFFPAASVPAVIYLGTDGAVQKVEIPEYGSNYLSDFRSMFSLDVQRRIADVGKMEDHLEFRFTHLEEPPLIVLSATPIP